MKEEYDFAGGERGKFYHEAAEFDLPIYLEPDVAAFLQKIAIKKGVEVETVVNDWLRRDVAFFVLSLADEFATEVELLRQNHAFLTLLDSYKQTQKTISLDEVEKRLR